MLMALATVVSSIAITAVSPTVNAATAPVARADVARTNAGASSGALFVLANDFDPDGDGLTLVEVSTPAHGTVSFNNSYISSYTPNAGFSGVETLTYTIRDDEGLTATSTLTVWVDTGTVTQPSAPNPQTDYFYVYQGSSVGFTTAQLLDNDVDPNNQPLTVVAVSEPSNNGTLTGNPHRRLRSTPPAPPPASSAPTANSTTSSPTPTATSTKSTIIIRILAAGDTNPIPVARADVARTNVGASPVRVTCCANDFDPDGGGLTLVEIVHPRPRHRVVQQQLHQHYTPNAGFSGVETITYTIRDSRRPHRHRHADGVGRHRHRTEPSAPTPQTDYFYVYQGSSVGFTTAQLLDNDVDPDNQPLTVVAVSEPSNNGTLTGTLTDGYDYTPDTDAGLIGTDSNLHYLVTDPDGHVDQGTITIRILATGDTNQPPVARADVARTNAGTSGVVSRAPNDFDPDGDAFTLVEIANPAHGTVSFNSSYITLHPQRRLLRRRNHHLHHPRQPRPHQHRHGDGVGRHRHHHDRATRRPNRLLLRLPRLLGRLHHRTTPRQRLRPRQPTHHRRRRVRTLQQRDPHRQPHRRLRPTPPTPTPRLIGTDSDLLYLVTDPDGHVEQGTITIRILATGDTNQPPVAVPDSAQTNAGRAGVVSTCASTTSTPTATRFTLVEVANPAHGTASFNSSYINYTPNAGFSGIETITYTLRDTHGLTATGLLTVLVGAIGDQPPVAQSASYSVQAGGTLPITLSAVDPNGLPLTWRLVTPPVGQLTGSLTGAAPQLTYTAPTNRATDAFVYEVSDGTLTAQATITITILRPNIDPVANDDTATTTQETPVTIDVLANDTDADGDILEVNGSTGSSHGSVLCSSTKCTYTPEPGYFGSDTFTYYIRDGFGGSGRGHGVGHDRTRHRSPQPSTRRR